MTCHCDIDLDPRPRLCWPGFSTSSSSRLLAPSSLGGSHCAQPTPDRGEAGAPPGGRSPHKLSRILPPEVCLFSPIYFFIQLFLYISVDLWTLILWCLIQQHVVHCAAQLVQLCPRKSPLLAPAAPSPGDQRPGQPPATCRGLTGHHQDLSGFARVQLPATCRFSR